MNIGELDRRIKLENYSVTQNDYGEERRTWSEYLEIWAKVDFNGGQAKDEFDKLTAISKAVFFIRNIGLSSLSEKTRILYNSKYYYIEAINEIEGRESFLELITEQRS